MERLTMVLPLPPSLNEMLHLAKKRTRRTRTGGWMKRSLPVVYDQELEAYERAALFSLYMQGVRAPQTGPWSRWRLVSSAFRVRNARDWIELLASLKWPVDVLVRQQFVLDDSPREMEPPPCPTQCIDRQNLGVTLTIERVA